MKLLTSCFSTGFRGRGGGGGGGPNFDIKGGDWPCPNRSVEKDLIFFNVIFKIFLV